METHVQYITDEEGHKTSVILRIPERRIIKPAVACGAPRLNL